MKTLALILAFSSLSLAAEACPLINGTFAKKEVNGSTTVTHTFSLVSVAAGGVTLYSLGNEMAPMAADGVAHPMSGGGQTGTLTLTCLNAAQMRADAVVNGQGSMSITYTKVSDTQIHVAATGEAAAMNGLYTKE